MLYYYYYENKMQEESAQISIVDKIKKVHAVALYVYISDDNQKSVDHFVTFYKMGARKSLIQMMDRLKDGSELEGTLFDLHMYVALIILTKKTYDSLKSIHYNALECQRETFRDVKKFKDQNSLGQPLTKQTGHLPSTHLINVFLNLDFILQQSMTKYSDLYEGKGEINQDAPNINTSIIVTHEGVPFDMYNNDPGAMVKLQQEGLEIFIEKSASYEYIYAKYGIIGIIVKLNEKIQKLADMTISDDINDILFDLFNYAAFGLTLC